MKINLHKRKTLSDLTSPVSLYLKLRELYPQVIMLESSDYSSKENNLSFICFDSLASIKIDKGVLQINSINDQKSIFKKQFDIATEIDLFTNQFEIENNDKLGQFNGIFGYTSYESVRYFESITIDNHNQKAPDLRYDFYKYIFVFDHYFQQLYLLENSPHNKESKIDEVLQIVSRQNHQTYPFQLKNEIKSNMDDDYFKNMVLKSKDYCKRGDVFQVVVSRRFEQEFMGDEFNVYRALRSINPSPYLFYFDYGSYKIFGSSPEAQLVVENNMATIHPIAGTFKRSSNPTEDVITGQQLMDDPKENAEHIMLVDLARNDLGKHAKKITISKLKELQYFSHVVHLVSKVQGDLKENTNPYKVFADSFPAGTLSGAPKYRAMQIIDKLEPTGRGYYGGAIGWIGFGNNLNHAIMIRSFMSVDGTLYFQAGAGIVTHSEPEKELQEVHNKLAALSKALAKAEEVYI